MKLRRLNNILKAARWLGLVKYLQFFILILTIFQHFDTFVYSIRRWDFWDNLDFSRKTVAKFLRRNHFLLV